MINARRTLDGAVCDIRERTYSVTLQQTEYRLTVDTEIAAFQYTDSADFSTAGMNLGYSETTIIWEAEGVCFYLVPAADYDALRPVYDNFMLNTRVSDEFIQLNQQLTEMLVTAMAKGRAQALSDYNVDVSTVADQTIGTGDSYVEDQFSDYILDQNDYTTSSGDHVKVSTSYDYVYENSNGDIYVTNSAEEPAGMSRLYAN